MITVLLILCLQAEPAPAVTNAEMFALQGENNILEEEHFGIINGLATIGVKYKDAASLCGFWSPPYVSSDFSLEITLFGEKVPANRYGWRPFEVTREGTLGKIHVLTAATLLYQYRAGMLSLSLKNTGDTEVQAPLHLAWGGTLDQTKVWEFSRPQSQTPAPAMLLDKGLKKTQGACVLALQTDEKTIAWDADASSGSTRITLAAGEEKTIHLCFGMGDASIVETCSQLLADSPNQVGQSRAEYNKRVEDLFTRLPRLTSDNPALETFYTRSLVHFLTNRWETPEFVLHPYYGTGSIKGGCVCNYLWNFGEVWEILPLYDPRAAREHIQQFLKIDITRHFAFIPTKGDAFGPWYMVNQEKIIGLIYFYVKNTGDADFLKEVVNGRSVLDWVVLNALHGDDPAGPVQLIDYGPSNSHLELRRGYPYNHIMPDLNGRRYMNYCMAAELCALMGAPAPYLKERAEALKLLLKQELWDPDLRWFRFKDAAGNTDLRYTVQLFKLVNSPVLDAEQRAGLLSHLNETEFLSEFGLHSMAKTDIAYDQVDIDNGGGGACTCFPPQIAERLYKSGHGREADDILRRILWWGERLPYWGDSLVANGMDYRKDTPLQCTLDGVTPAQCIIFGLFGVDAAFNGDITFRPQRTALASRLKLTGLTIRNNTFDIEVAGEEYSVRCGDRQIRAALPKALVFLAQEKEFHVSE